MRQFTSFVVAVVVLSSIVASSAFAGDRVIPRISLTAEKVASDGTWTKMAKNIGLPFKELFKGSDGSATGTSAILPTPCVGRMYGGAWGMSGSEQKMMIGGYELWKQSECPGVLGNTPAGVIIHAQLGANGTKFLFVGVKAGSGTNVAAAQNLKSQLEAALANPDSADWQAFDKAVANTTTGRSVAALYNKLHLEYDPDQDKAVKAGSIQQKQAAADKPSNEKAAEGVKSTGSIAGDLWRFAKSLWWLWLILVILILVICFWSRITEWWQDNVAWRFSPEEEAEGYGTPTAADELGSPPARPEDEIVILPDTPAPADEPGTSPAPGSEPVYDEDDIDIPAFLRRRPEPVAPPTNTPAPAPAPAAEDLSDVDIQLGDQPEAGSGGGTQPPPTTEPGDSKQ
jgi:hypothetical protein